MRSEAARTSSSARPLGAAAVAALCLAAQLAIVAHAALVEHVRCPAHGDLVHPGEPHEHHDLQALRGEPDWAPSDDRDAGEHEHCAVLARLSESAPGISPLGGEPREIEWLAPRAPAFAPRASPIARFRVAPKSSPPLA
jgi:hypothetical protein